ncbi:hypothetical protein [Planotetraspora mira]|uniref:Uncharacterized protein n=1 Tax=Planotetraspora mira TaxID=58121 RepID=A0A8J3TXI7_9ACTN|nr:hypothetical protein [Planotetraspora mira]GII34316.1 hypothetical protein Pmi06nite_77580 [Planotetraspora mira]
MRLAEFNAYLDRQGASPTADAVSYRQGTIWLTPDELGALIGTLLAVLDPTSETSLSRGPRAVPAQPHPVPHRPANPLTAIPAG